MSLRLKLLAAFTYVLVLVLVALEIPLVLSLSSRVDNEVRAQAAAQAQGVAAAAAARLDDEPGLVRVVERAGSDLGARVVVVDAKGRLLADSAGTAAPDVSYAGRPEIAAALAGRSEQGTRQSDTLGGELLYTAVPVLDEGRTVGAVRVTQSNAAVSERVRRNVFVVVGVGLAALALGLGLAWVLAGQLAGPLRALARTARRVEEGELDARAEVTGASEQREVALAFNDMTERLAQVLEAQREFVGNASHQLRTPLTGLRLRLEAAAVKSDDPAVRHDLELAEAEVERLTRLLNALLTLARGGDRPTLRAPASLRAAAESAYERWLPRAEASGHALVLDGDGEALVRAGEEDVAIALDNLIENALVYAPHGTTVTLA
ncbi:MAG: sensor histidine kinase, partial [Gaiellaceae bacterium]